MNKKGLSPVIASVLLVALVLVLGTIIYLWARAFIPEVLEKSGMPIENSCNDVVFDASYTIGMENIDSLTVQNNGNVPIYGIRYGIEEIGSLVYYELYHTIGAGGSWSWQITPKKAGPEDNIRIIPLILGKASTGELKAFACEDSTERIKAQNKAQ